MHETMGPVVGGKEVGGLHMGKMALCLLNTAH